MKKIIYFSFLTFMSMISFSQNVDILYPAHNTVISSSLYEKDTLLLNLSNSKNYINDYDESFLKQLKVYRQGGSILNGNYFSEVDSTVQSVNEGRFIKMDSFYITIGPVFYQNTQNVGLVYSIGTNKIIDSLYSFKMTGFSFGFNDIKPHPFNDSSILVYGDLVDSTLMSGYFILEFNLINQSYVLHMDSCNSSTRINSLIYDDIQNRYIVTSGKPLCPSSDSLYGNSFAYFDTNLNIATPTSTYIDLSYTPYFPCSNCRDEFAGYSLAMEKATDSTLMLVGNIDNPSVVFKPSNVNSDRWGYDVGVSMRRTSDFSEIDTTRSYGRLNVAEEQSPPILEKMDSNLFVTATNLELEGAGVQPWNTELALLGLDERGTKHWMKYFPFNDYCWVKEMHPDEKGGLWIVAQCSEFNQKDQFVKVMYIDSVAYWPRVGQSTDITEHIGKWDRDFKVFPNPATEAVFIRQYGKLQVLNATFFDVNGRLVKEASLGEMDSKIDVHDLPSGMYFIKIDYQGHYLGTEKVMVN